MTNYVCRTSVKVLPNGIVMNSSCCGHKYVPDGMGKRNDSIALEEHHTQTIYQASPGNLLKSIGVALSINKERLGMGCKGGKGYFMHKIKCFRPRKRKLAVNSEHLGCDRWTNEKPSIFILHFVKYIIIYLYNMSPQHYRSNRGTTQELRQVGCFASCSLAEQTNTEKKKTTLLCISVSVMQLLLTG